MTNNVPEWFKYKYDLCENEIQCDGKTIAYADNSIFDIKDKEEFSRKLQAMGLRLGWLVQRANLASEMLEALKRAQTHLCVELEGCRAVYDEVERIIAKAENKSDAAQKDKTE